jgi:hypothetical protein
MTTYRMTDAERKALLDASKPVPYMVIGGVPPSSPYDNAMRVWREIANRVGCEVDSIEPASTGDDHDFKAVPRKVTA